MKIFLIHDILRTDRENLYRREFDEQGIVDYEIMPAVKRDLNAKKNIAEAHKSCVRRAKEENLPRVLILEDDIMFACKGAYDEFLRLSSLLPDDWDIYTSGSYDYRMSRVYNTGNHLTSPFTELSVFSGLHCYMVNSIYYDIFLATRGFNNLDKELRGKIFMTWPMMALQHDTFSDNRKMMTNYNTIFSKKIELWKNTDLKRS